MKQKKENMKRKPWIIAILLLVVVCASAVAVVKLYHRDSDKQPKDSHGVVGKVSSGWSTGIKNEPEQPKRGIQIPGYGSAEMKAGEKTLRLSVGNPETNECGFYATVKLADGTVLYQSELLEPGYGLQEIPLSRSLEAGEYIAVVFYQCVTLDKEHTPLNSAESEFKLIVK